MSRTTVLGVIPDQRPVHLAEWHNGHGWGPSIWKRLCLHNGLADPFGIHANMLRLEHKNHPLDQLWRLTEDLPEWQQIPLVLTFDTGVIPAESFKESADLLEEFEQRLPERAGYVNHVPAMVELLRQCPEVPLLGVYGTSVSENPFDPWDEEKDDYGSGIPLTAMYLLPQHRAAVGRA